ncbi:MAG: UbiA prenyltransferase family protein [Bacilli bacterium]|jgi:decaprenyl-phosphate phosphoribosyltransferase
MKKYIKLCRVKHYIKNGLIFLPLLFVKKMFSSEIINVIYGAIAFCLMSSVVYIINDIMDASKDCLHPIKKHRPIASKEITKKTALFLALLLFIISLLFNYLAVGSTFFTYFLLLFYLIMNLGYSFGIKSLVLMDVLFLVLGFIIRVYYGASIINVNVSNWLYLTIMSGAFFFAFGKRRNEILKTNGETRQVLKMYNKDFLDKNIYMFLSLTITFYSLWAIVQNIQYLIVTIPLMIIILLRYTMIIEGDSYGDPTDVLLNDRFLMILLVLFGIIMLCLMR